MRMQQSLQNVVRKKKEHIVNIKAVIVMEKADIMEQMEQKTNPWKMTGKTVKNLMKKMRSKISNLERMTLESELIECLS